MSTPFKMKYKKSSFPFKTDPVKKAKRLVKNNVANTTVDGGGKDSKFDKSNKKIMKANELLKKAGYTLGQREQATGAGGYKAAMDWATKKDKK
tara:strand:- start:50 stop:328 length:279 start_codon:yes stop_codon:yes gene_type:complete